MRIITSQLLKYIHIIFYIINPILKKIINGHNNNNPTIPSFGNKFYPT
jgi:hypothetical protein